MQWLIFSDIHDNQSTWQRFLESVQGEAELGLICLGDVGRSPAILEELRRRGVRCVFGNWEVSGLTFLPEGLATWVADWPGVLQLDSALLCHATPDLPPEAATTRSAARFMEERGVSWRQLFPSLDRDEEARWRALAVMEAQDAPLLFHGHTHVQQAWGWGRDARGRLRLRPLTASRIVLEPEGGVERAIIGVGSLGAPMDGPHPRYVRYDDRAQVVTLERLA